MNISKYQTTNLSSQNQLSNLNNSMQYQQNALRRQSSVTKQEQSVERLKSCIADLKKLASNKVKRGGVSTAIDQPPSFGQNCTGYQQEEESYLKPKERHSTAGSVTRTKYKSSNQISNTGGYERKTHQTKIANALKKYISEIEQTTSQGYPKDQKRDSHRHKSASNKKRSSRHKREDSFSKRNEHPLQRSSKKSNSKSNLQSQKKNLENSMRSNKAELTGSQQSRQPKKAQSVERIPHQGYEKGGEKSYVNTYSNMGRSGTTSYIGNQKPIQSTVARSSSVTNHSSYQKHSHHRKESDEIHQALSGSSSAIHSQKYTPSTNKDKKPFTFNNYILNQPESQTYKNQGSVTTTSKVDKSFLNSSSQAIDIRIQKGNDSFIVANNQAQGNDHHYYGSKKAYEYKPSDIMRSQSQELRYPLSTSASNVMKHELSHFGGSQAVIDTQNTNSASGLTSYQQKLQPREMKEFNNTKGSVDSRKEEQKHRSQEKKQDPKKDVRSLQELAQMTQSTDFSENRIQSLEQKRIMSIQSNNPNNNNLNPPFPSSIYSIQHPASQLSVPYCPNSLSIAQNNMTCGVGALMRTHVTREDFNIEDLHMQIVMKMQRMKHLIKEIECLPGEKDPEYLLDDLDLQSTGQKKRGRKDQTPPQMLVMVNEEILGSDGCTRPVINFRKKQ